jgi:hypothetical protein
VADHFSAGGEGEDLRKAFAAVGERTEVERPLRMALAQGAGGEIAGLPGGEGVASRAVRESLNLSKAIRARIRGNLSRPSRG